MPIEPIQIEFKPEGLEAVNSAFAEVAATSKRTGESVQRDSEAMSFSIKEFSRDLTVLSSAGSSIIRLATDFGILSKEQTQAARTMLDVISGASGLIRISEILSSVLTVEAAAHAFNTVAKWAEAHASAVLLGIASFGIGIPIILAAMAAATSGVASAQASAPRMAEGGIVSRPTLALIGERGPEAVVPLNRGFGTTVNICNPTFRNRSDINYLVDRLKRMGVA